MRYGADNIRYLKWPQSVKFIFLFFYKYTACIFSLFLIITIFYFLFPKPQSQLSPISKGTYKEYLGKLDLQYGKLLVNGFFFFYKSFFYLITFIWISKFTQTHCFVSELLQVPLEEPGIAAHLRHRCDQGANVAEWQRGGGGQLWLEWQEHQHDSEERKLLCRLKVGKLHKWWS